MTRLLVFSLLLAGAALPGAGCSTDSSASVPNYLIGVGAVEAETPSFEVVAP